MAGKVTPKKLTPAVEEAMLNQFDYLASRWEDECEYEDIQDCVKSFEKQFSVRVVKFKTTPLAFSFRYGDYLCALLAAEDNIKFTKRLSPSATPTKLNRKAVKAVTE